MRMTTHSDIYRVTPLDLIDWAERYPNETALEIAVRQSTVCPCGKPKDIGAKTCGHGSSSAETLERTIREFEAWQRGEVSQ